MLVYPSCPQSLMPVIRPTEYRRRQSDTGKYNPMSLITSFGIDHWELPSVINHICVYCSLIIDNIMEASQYPHRES